MKVIKTKFKNLLLFSTLPVVLSSDIKAGLLAGILTVFGAPVVILVQLEVRPIDEGAA